MKRTILYLFLVLTIAATVGPPTIALASSQPTFKVEIVAPECTLDTIDDGLGPVQVVTCPPGTIDPEPGGSPIEEENPNGNNNTSGTTPGRGGNSVSQRVYSSNDTLALLEIFRDPDLSLDVLERIGPQKPATETDIIPLIHERSVAESLVIPSAIITVASVSAAYLLAGPRISRGILKFLRHK